MEAKHTASGGGISTSELAKCTKSLKAAKSREHSDSLEYDSTIADTLAALYEKHDGDIRGVFEELDECPRKALKYPPASAAEFGKKYAQGFYTYAAEEK